MEEHKRYHINPETGVIGECKASIKECPFGGEEVHFDSWLEAGQAYSEGKDILVSFTKKKGNLWINKSWGERKEILNNIVEEMKENIFRRGTISVEWMKYIESKIPGYASFGRFTPKQNLFGSRKINFSEEIQVLEELHAKATIFHEIAHWLSEDEISSHGIQWDMMKNALVNRFSHLAPGIETDFITPKKNLTKDERNRLRHLRKRNEELIYEAFCEKEHVDDYAKTMGEDVRFCQICWDSGVKNIIKWRVRKNV